MRSEIVTEEQLKTYQKKYSDFTPETMIPEKYYWVVPWVIYYYKGIEDNNFLDWAEEASVEELERYASSSNYVPIRWFISADCLLSDSNGGTTTILLRKNWYGKIEAHFNKGNDFADVRAINSIPSDISKFIPLEVYSYVENKQILNFRTNNKMNIFSRLLKMIGLVTPSKLS